MTWAAVLTHAGGMAAFDWTTDAARLDYQLLMRSPVRLIHDRAMLRSTVAWLREHDYWVVEVEASWLIPSHIFRDLGSALGYVCHDRFHCLGEGLDAALNEALARHAGFALALTGFDVFVRHHIDDAHVLLETVAERAWPAALLGERVICLAQSDDPALRLRRIGMWTLPRVDHEWRTMSGQG